MRRSIVVGLICIFFAQHFLCMQQKATNKYIATEAFLRVWFNVPDDVVLTQENLQNSVYRIVKRVAQDVKNKKDMLTNLDEYMPIVMAMIDNEFRYANDYVFYHAFRRELGLLFDLQKEVHNFLQSDSVSMMLLRDMFELQLKIEQFPYKNADELLKENTEYIRKTKGTKGNMINDAYEPWSIFLLSANLALCANVEDFSSSSLYYFMSSSNLSDIDYLKIFFDRWSFDDVSRQKIKKLHDETFEVGGHMLQICIPESQVNRFTYLSRKQGYPFRLNSAGKQAIQSWDDFYYPNMLDTLKLYRNNPNKFSAWKPVPEMEDRQIIDRLQARILLIPDFFDTAKGIKLFQYHTKPKKSVEEYQRILHEYVREMLINWLKTSKSNELITKFNLNKIEIYKRLGLDRYKDVTAAYSQDMTILRFIL